MATNFHRGQSCAATPPSGPGDYEFQLDQFLDKVADCVDRLSWEVEEMRRELNTSG